MALFKPLKGTRASLDSQPLHDGYAYFCTDDGSFHIDYIDADGNLQRKQLNAKDAETIMGKSFAELQSDWSINDETDPAYIKNRPFYTTDPIHVEYANGTYAARQNGETVYAVSLGSTSYPVEEGQEFTVVFDSDTYNATVKQEILLGTSFAVLGNTQVLSELVGEDAELEDTGEPFCILFSNGSMLLYTNELDNEHTVVLSSYTTQHITIPHKYLGLNIKNGSGEYSVVTGNSSTASGQYAHAEGVSTVASGLASHSEGASTSATGQTSHAEGTGSVASGIDSHAEGNYTQATKAYAHAEGYNTVASGEYGSHAEGYFAVASGDMSHAEGSHTEAKGAHAHAEGFRTIAAGEHQHVEGQYNIEDTENKYIHIAGNGSKNGPVRSNAHTLDWDGNAWFAGDVYVGSNSGKNKDEGSVKLATIDQITSHNTNTTAHTDIRTDVNKALSAVSISGGELVLNGNGILGNNTNFTLFNFDATQSNNSYGSFVTPEPNKLYQCSSTNNIYLDSSKDYVLSIDAKSLNGLATNYLTLVYYDSSNTFIGNSSYIALFADIPPAGEWTTYTGTLNGTDIPENAAYAKIRISLNYNKVDDLVWVTNVSFKEKVVTEETDPTVPAWAKQPNKPTYTASDVGADSAGTATTAVNSHNVSTDAHNDVRLLIGDLTTRLNALANSTDEDLDQMAEIVAYIKSNKSLIDEVTTKKVNVADIIDNLTTNVTNKPLSAAQGVVLKGLIDDKSGGGIYVGSGDMPANCNVQIDPDGIATDLDDIVSSVISSLPNGDEVSY